MSRRYEVGVGLLVVTAAGLLTYMALQIGAIRGSGPTVEVDALFPDAAGLTEGAVVSVAGVQVGRVSGLDVEFDRARARLSIDAGADIRADVKVRIRARSVLGEKYVELVPVSKDAPPLQDGVTLTDATGQVEIDEMVSDMGPLLRAVDPKAIEVLTQSMAADPELPKRMLADAEATLKNLRAASEELPGLIRDTRDTLGAVKATTARAEATLGRADQALGRADKLLAEVDPQQVNRVMAEAEAAAKDARKAIQHADESLSEVDKATREAQKFLKGWSTLDWETFRRVAQESGIYVRVSPVDRKK
jgi:phospholipid/cholesterol/gamma-HCH transport system substrate-binding protein